MGPEVTPRTILGETLVTISWKTVRPDEKSESQVRSSANPYIRLHTQSDTIKRDQNYKIEAEVVQIKINAAIYNISEGKHEVSKQF